MEITIKNSIDFTRIFDIIEYQTEKYANASALNSFSGGQWKGLSIHEIRNKVDALSCWFIQNKFLKEEKIIFMPVIGSPDWMILDFACQQAGMVVVPIHPTSRAEELKTILSETEARLFITADARLCETFRPLISGAGRKIELYHLEPNVSGYFQPALLSNAPAAIDLRRG